MALRSRSQVAGASWSLAEAVEWETEGAGPRDEGPATVLADTVLAYAAGEEAGARPAGPRYPARRDAASAAAADPGDTVAGAGPAPPRRGGKSPGRIFRGAFPSRGRPARPHAADPPGPAAVRDAVGGVECAPEVVAPPPRDAPGSLDGNLSSCGAIAPAASIADYQAKLRVSLASLSRVSVADPIASAGARDSQDSDSSPERTPAEQLARRAREEARAQQLERAQRLRDFRRRTLLRVRRRAERDRAAAPESAFPSRDARGAAAKGRARAKAPELGGLLELYGRGGRRGRHRSAGAEPAPRTSPPPPSAALQRIEGKLLHPRDVTPVRRVLNGLRAVRDSGDAAGAAGSPEADGPSAPPRSSAESGGDLDESIAREVKSALSLLVSYGFWDTASSAGGRGNAGGASSAGSASSPGEGGAAAEEPSQPDEVDDILASIKGPSLESLRKCVGAVREEAWRPSAAAVAAPRTVAEALGALSGDASGDEVEQASAASSSAAGAAAVMGRAGEGGAADGAARRLAEHAGWWQWQHGVSPS